MAISFGRPLPQPTHNFMGGELPDEVTLTRASAGLAFASDGVLTSNAIDAARFAYDPTALVLRGMLNEPASTCSIRHSDCAGTANGTPGTAPTNWVVTSTANNVARTIVGAGTEDGIPYVDIQYSGTPSSSGTVNIAFEANTQVAALQGQTWTATVYGKLAGGGFTNFNANTPNLAMNERDNAGASLATSSTAVFRPTSAALRTQAFGVTYTTVQAATAFITGRISFGYTSGNAINATLRIGIPNPILSATALSPVITAGAAVTRAADIVTLIDQSGTHDIWVARTNGITAHSAVDLSGGTWAVPTSAYPLLSVLVKP